MDMMNQSILLNAELAFVPVDGIQVDYAYQRNLDTKRLERLRRAFDRGACKAISLSRREDGSLWVYDGHHTLNLHIKLGHKTVPAVIVPGDQKREARWFLLMNSSGTSKARPNEVHKAGLAAADELATDIQGLLNTYGLTIARNGGVGHTTAIGTLRTWLKADRERLIRAMDLIDRLWCQQPYAWTQVVIRGVWDIATHDDVLAHVERGLAKHKVTPRRILDTAQGMQGATGLPGGGSGYAKAAILKLAKVKT